VRGAITKEDPLGIVGQLVADKYRIERLVGEGGFAVVYRAEHVIWQHAVALKCFNALALVPSAQQRELEQAFINEGALLARLSSRTSAIVQAHDIGSLESADGRRVPFLVLEWVDGVTLDTVLEAERSSGAPPWSLEQVRRVLGPVARAVDVVHEASVAHRDLTPGNILLLGSDPRNEPVRIKILDFGVAKLMLESARFQAALAATGKTLSSEKLPAFIFGTRSANRRAALSTRLSDVSPQACASGPVIFKSKSAPGVSVSRSAQSANATTLSRS